jgi:hypothetical protein
MIVLQVMINHRLERKFDESGQAKEMLFDVLEEKERTIRLVIVEDNQKALDFLVRKLRYAGFEGERLEDLNLIGEHVRLTCSHQPYDGDVSEQWDLALPPRERQPLSLSGPHVMKANAILGSRLKGAGVAKAPPKHREASFGTTSSDDDLPF